MKTSPKNSAPKAKIVVPPQTPETQRFLEAMRAAGFTISHDAYGPTWGSNTSR